MKDNRNRCSNSSWFTNNLQHTQRFIEPESLHILLPFSVTSRPEILFYFISLVQKQVALKRLNMMECANFYRWEFAWDLIGLRSLRQEQKLSRFALWKQTHLDKYECGKSFILWLKLAQWFTGFQLNECYLLVSREKLIRTFVAWSENCGRVVDIFYCLPLCFMSVHFILAAQQSMLRASQRERGEREKLH